MATFGGTKKHRVEDSKGNTLTKQTIEFYPTQADAQAGTNIIGTAKIDVEGDWSFTASQGEVWCKIADYGIWKETDLSSTFARTDPTTGNVIDGNGQPVIPGEPTQAQVDSAVAGKGFLVAPTTSDLPEALVSIRDSGDKRTWLEASKTDGGPTAFATAAIRDALAVPPPRTYVADGDSLTEASSGGGTPYPSKLAVLLGKDVLNLGRSGSTAVEISTRAGGVVPVLTLTDTALPADTTPITVTWDAPAPFSGTNTVDRVTDVTVQGVPCILTYVVATGAVTLARKTAAGSPTPLPSKVAAIPVTPYTGASYVHIFWAGRNNYPPSTAQDPIVRAAEYFRLTATPFLVVSETTGNPGGGAVSSDKADIVALNDALRAKYPREFVNLRGRLIREGLALAGVTATTTDNTAISNDEIPPSLYADSVHFNDSGRVAVAAIIKNELQIRGLA